MSRCRALRSLGVDMNTRRARLLGFLIATMAGLAQARGLGQESGIDERGDKEVQLARVLRDIETEHVAPADAGRASTAADRVKLVTGAVNFFRPFPGGNGRACAT